MNTTFYFVKDKNIKLISFPKIISNHRHPLLEFMI